MLPNWLASSITLGIVRCGLCSAAESAIPVMPGTLAMVTNGGASVLGERGCGDRSTSWHSEQSFRAVVNPAAGASCAIADGPASAVAAKAIDPISLVICFMADTPTKNILALTGPRRFELGQSVKRCCQAVKPCPMARTPPPVAAVTWRVTIAFVLLLMRSRPAV